MRKIPAALKRFVLSILFLTMIVSLAACGSKPAFKEEDTLKVTSTIGMITDIVKQVGGSLVEAIGLMKAGVDPHLYKASQGDIRKLEEADIVFYNGLHLEGKMTEILEQMSKKKPAVAVSRDLPTASLRAGEGTETQYDPHIWFDVRNWMSATKTVRDELIKLDPKHEADYQKNADSYLKQLQELHDYTLKQISVIPEKGRVLVTAHDAFGYFGAAYGIKVMGLQGISTAAEAGTKDVSNLRDYLVENQIKAVFVESSVPKKTIEAVQDGAKKKGHDVKIGGELFSDAMGEDGTPEGTYIGMVRHNVDTIVNALK